MSSPPAVSVLMPVFNSRRFVPESIESILRQTFCDLELVAIDDGSDDDSFAVLRRYARSDTRVRFLGREHRGIVETRNELLSMARGRYIAVNDADDVSLPHRIARQVTYLEANPEVACAGGRFELMDAGGRRLTTLTPPPDDAGIQARMLAGHCAIHHSTAMVPRWAMDRVGGYDNSFRLAQDLDLFLRIGEVGRLANLDAVLTRVRLHPGSVSEVHGDAQRAYCRSACEAAWQRRGLEGRFEATQPWRPGRDRQSRHRYALLYGWWALKSGQRRTALLYAAKGIATQPLAAAGWRLAARAASQGWRWGHGNRRQALHEPDSSELVG